MDPWALYRSRDAGPVREALAALEGASSGAVTEPLLHTERPYPGPEPRLPRPERDGIRSETVFGPVHDFRCYCGKWRGEERAGVRCEKCGVEVAPASLRGSRLAHAPLAAPVLPSVFATEVAARLGLSVADVRAVARYEAWLEGSGGDLRCVHAPRSTEDPAVPPERLARSGVAALEAAGAGPVSEWTFDRLPLPPPDERPLVASHRQWLPNPFDLDLVALLGLSKQLEQLTQLGAPEPLLAANRAALQRCWDEVLDSSPVPLEASPLALSRPQSEPLEGVEAERRLHWVRPEELLLVDGASALAVGLDGTVRWQTTIKGLPEWSRLCGTDPSGRFLLFDSGELHLLDTRDPTEPRWCDRWPDEWPPGQRAFVVGRHATDARTGERLVRYCQDEAAAHGWGRGAWIGPYVHASDGAVIARPADWWDEHRWESGPVALLGADGVPTRRTLDPGFIEEAVFAQADRTPRDVRALAFTADGEPTVLWNNHVARPTASLLFIAWAYDDAALSPDGSELALMRGAELRLVHFGEGTVRQVALPPTPAA